MNDGRIRILLVDDHFVVRQGFKYFIDVIDDLKLVGEASNGQAAIMEAARLKPDVILMDLVMPKVNGIEATKAILASNPRIKIIALTSFTDDESMLQAALAAGVSGYFFKDLSVDELANAVRKVHRGEVALASNATDMLVKVTKSSRSQAYHLTEREKAVMRLMAVGLNNREIAEKLIVSQATVKFHVSSILSKLGAATRTEAVAIAVQHKLV